MVPTRSAFMRAKAPSVSHLDKYFRLGAAYWLFCAVENRDPNRALEALCRNQAYISNIWEWRWAHSSTLKMFSQPAEMRNEMSHAVILHIVWVRDLSIFYTHTHIRNSEFLQFLYCFCVYQIQRKGVWLLSQSQWKGVASGSVRPSEGGVAFVSRLNGLWISGLVREVWPLCGASQRRLAAVAVNWSERSVASVAVYPSFSEGGVASVAINPSEKDVASVNLSHSKGGEFQFHWRKCGLNHGHYQRRRCGLCVQVPVKEVWLQS